MPRMHPREIVVRKAESELHSLIAKWASDLEKNEESDLTVWEYIQVVQSVLSSTILNLAKIQIRIERHGDPNKPGGFA